MDISERIFGDVTVLALNGKFILEDGDKPFKDRIDRLLLQGRTYVVLNMKDVTYLDSCGVGVLAWKFVTICKQGGTIKLANLSPRSHGPLFITRLLDVFEVFDTEEEAVGSFDPGHARPGAFTRPRTT